MLNIAVLEEQAQAARDAGFTKVAIDLQKKVDRQRKLVIAYEHYRYVSQERFAEFNARLKKSTERPVTDKDRAKVGWNATKVADQLTLIALESYPGLPPADVLAKVKEARERMCFDNFEVAEINPVATEVKLPDPIVFGCVEGCTDRFFIAEWGKDVSISDLLQTHEG